MSSSLSQSQPPLLSLNVRRTVDAIIEMDANDTSVVIGQSLNQTKNKEEHQIPEHEEEIRAMKDLLEQQCFAFVSYHNHVQDARKVQKAQMEKFTMLANNIQDRLESLSSALFNKVKEINHRIDIIQRTLSPKPIFKRILPQNDFGRVTGIDVNEKYLVFTTAGFYVVIVDKDKFDVIHAYQPLPNNSLFHPTLVLLPDGNDGLFCISANRKLLFSNPVLSTPEQCFNDNVECFAVNQYCLQSQSAFDIVLGHHQCINFCKINPENLKELNIVATTKDFRGNVTSLVVDNDNDAIYALSSKRIFYCVSSSSYQISFTINFQTPLMQLGVTRMFIIISYAPNNIIIAERNSKEFKQIYQFEISKGLRRFCTSDKCIYIITKDQEIEKRCMCHPHEVETICEVESADYDRSEYIGCIYCDHTDIYLSHGNRISLWI